MVPLPEAVTPSVPLPHACPHLQRGAFELDHRGRLGAASAACDTEYIDALEAARALAPLCMWRYSGVGAPTGRLTVRRLR